MGEACGWGRPHSFWEPPTTLPCGALEGDGGLGAWGPGRWPVERRQLAEVLTAPWPLIPVPRQGPATPQRPLSSLAIQKKPSRRCVLGVFV